MAQVEYVVRGAKDVHALRLTKQALTATLDTAGMRRALLDALERDMEIEAHETDESREFNRIVAADGPQAWRRARSGISGD